MVQFMPCLLDKNENYIDNCMYVVKSLMVTSNHKEKKDYSSNFYLNAYFIGWPLSLSYGLQSVAH